MADVHVCDKARADMSTCFVPMFVTCFFFYNNMYEVYDNTVLCITETSPMGVIGGCNPHFF